MFLRQATTAAWDSLQYQQQTSFRDQSKLSGDVMNEVLQAAGIQVMEGVFHRAIERSREEPAATLPERLDRLTRLRAILKGSEQHFERAISADFGTRSPTETLIAETLFVLGEIKHATQHLRKWLAPQRVPTA